MAPITPRGMTIICNRGIAQLSYSAASEQRWAMMKMDNA